MVLIDLIKKYLKQYIVGIPDHVLSKILSGFHPTISVKTISNGIIVLTNKKILKCVNNYYENPDNLTKIKKDVNECYSTQKHFNINYTAINSCANCHLICLQKKKSNQLRRKY